MILSLTCGRPWMLSCLLVREQVHDAKSLARCLGRCLSHARSRWSVAREIASSVPRSVSVPCSITVVSG